VFPQKAVVEKIAQRAITGSNLAFQVESGNAFQGGVFLAATLTLPGVCQSHKLVLMADQALILTKVNDSFRHFPSSPQIGHASRAARAAHSIFQSQNPSLFAGPGLRV